MSRCIWPNPASPSALHIYNYAVPCRGADKQPIYTPIHSYFPKACIPARHSLTWPSKHKRASSQQSSLHFSTSHLPTKLYFRYNTRYYQNLQYKLIPISPIDITMRLTQPLALTGAFAFSAYATPIPEGAQQQCSSTITPEQLIAIAPKTASCNGAAFPDECADAARAAPAISASFKQYQIESKGAQAALIAIMLFESGSFQFNKNHFPGRPGQGTKNMQMPEFNREYATATVGADKVALAEVPNNVNATAEAILGLVNSNDTLSFGSAAWYLNTKCDVSFKANLADGSQKTWDEYLTGCIETTADKERDDPWIAAKRVLMV
ncbi:unnamed protein product [Periconia digitata]|uniref:Uncharacterized protein n=1 Tax=Periconia digitata TaxID=1303443 RepID=A0A9W4UAP6_9PLEO|nr:unnamed protein product [Periconia digitata]